MTRTLLVALAVLAVTAPAASARTLTWSTASGAVYRDAEGVRDAVAVGFETNGFRWTFVPQTGGAALAAGDSNCFVNSWGHGSCPGAGPLRLELGGGDDHVALWTTNGTGPEIDGGAGDDTLESLVPGAVLRGGAGADTVKTGDPVVVSLDGAANDGRVHQATANVHPDVEHVLGSPYADEITGSAAANTLTGGAGNDALRGEAGADRLIGEGGDDAISARDGHADVVDCGFGQDTAVVDRADTVQDCETVDVPPAPRPVTPPPAPKPTTPAPAPRPTTPAPPVAPVELTARVRHRWRTFPRFTTVLGLTVRDVPAGAHVEVRCRGAGCPFARRGARIRGGRATLAPLFRGRRLKPGAVVEIRVTRPGAVGRSVAYTVRPRKLPAARERRLTAAGAARP